MPITIRVPFNAFKEVEKRLKYMFGDRERERSNRAAGMADMAMGTRRLCPMRHDQIAWSGPPHDSVRSYICLLCSAMASEAEIKHRGYNFNEVPDWIIHQILDLDLERQTNGNKKLFSMSGGSNQR
jgi:hypothetical protein